MMNHSMHFSTRPTMTFKNTLLVTRMVFFNLNYLMHGLKNHLSDAKVVGIGRRWMTHSQVPSKTQDGP
jgi:hypothetical protein